MSALLPNIIASGPIGGGEANTIAKWIGDGGKLDYSSNVLIDNNDNMLDIACSASNKAGMQIKAISGQTNDLFKIKYGGTDYFNINKKGNLTTIKADPSILNNASNFILGGGGTGLTHGSGSEGYFNTGYGIDSLALGGVTTIYNVSAFGYKSADQNEGRGVSSFGSSAAYLNTGNYVSGFGSLATKENTGDYVSGFGYNAASGNIVNNVSGFGSYATYQNEGANTIAMGYYAAYQNEGDNVVSIGFQACRQNTGGNVIAIGYQAGYQNSTNNQFIIKQASVNAVPLIQGDLYTGKLGIGIVTPASMLHINQYSTSRAIPVLSLNQADISEEFIKFTGESTVDNSQSLIDAADLTTPGNITGWIKVYIEDVASSGPITDGIYFIPFYSTPTA